MEAWKAFRRAGSKQAQHEVAPVAVARPEPWTDILQLQRLAGNAAVAGLASSTPDPGAAVRQVLDRGGQPLDDTTRADMETRFGTDFGEVRIHTDGASRESAAAIGARAYTAGNHIVLGEDGTDRHTIAHELSHVIQQREGSVAGALDDRSGLRLSDPSDPDERAAERAAQRVLAASPGTTAGALDPGGSPHESSSVPVVQRATGTQSGQVTFATTLPPNPALYTDFTNYWVGPDGGEPTGYIRIEQFCGFLSLQWLAADGPAGGLRFDQLPAPDRDSGVDTLRDWASQGGMAAQQAAAAAQLPGATQPTTQAVQTQLAQQHGYPAGTLFWMADNVHVVAARSLGRGRYLFYDPNLGTATQLDTGAFDTEVARRNAFVVSAPPPTCECCVIL